MPKANSKEPLPKVFDVTILDTEGNELGRARVRNCGSASAARRLVLATLVTYVKEVGGTDPAEVDFNSNQSDLLK